MSPGAGVVSPGARNSQFRFQQELEYNLNPAIANFALAFQIYFYFFHIDMQDLSINIIDKPGKVHYSCFNYLFSPISYIFITPEDKMQDINKMLSFEVKKEIAERYFGFRKLIEEDIINYNKLIETALHQFKKNISSDLARLKTLLKYPEIIHLFLKTTGLENIENVSYRPEFSVDVKKADFTHIPIRGITRKGRFRNILFSIYDELTMDINSYRKLFKQIEEEQQIISEEIKLFYQKNDLGLIMDFLRNIDGPGSYKAGSMEGGLAPGTGEKLDRKMRVTPPPPADRILPNLPRPHPAKEIKEKLKQIADTTWNRQGKPEIIKLIN